RVALASVAAGDLRVQRSVQPWWHDHGVDHVTELVQDQPGDPARPGGLPRAAQIERELESVRTAACEADGVGLPGAKRADVDGDETIDHVDQLPRLGPGAGDRVQDDLPVGGSDGGGEAQARALDRLR